MLTTYRRFSLAALGAASLLLATSGCASETTEQDGELGASGDHMVLRGTTQALAADGDSSLRVAARWSTEADVPGVYIQIDEVSDSGPDRGAFDLRVAHPPVEVIEQGHDADYMYTSAELVLLDNDSLANGWADPHVLNDSEVGRSKYIIYYVDSDIPADATGHFGIGPVDAGFHLLERQKDRKVYDDEGRETGGIAVWKEVPVDTAIEIGLGDNLDPMMWW